MHRWVYLRPISDLLNFSVTWLTCDFQERVLSRITPRLRTSSTNSVCSAASLIFILEIWSCLKILIVCDVPKTMALVFYVLRIRQFSSTHAATVQADSERKPTSTVTGTWTYICRSSAYSSLNVFLLSRCFLTSLM